MEVSEYDKAGNRTAKLINGIEAERYQYDARNRLVSQDILSLRADGANTPEHKEYTYDEQGNMISDGRRSFTYDAMNRFSQVTTTEGNIQKNRYDGEGLRAEMEENGKLVSFLFDGQKMVAETDCDQNTIRYVRGYELISSDSEKAKTYYHYASDEMGSITHITDEAGNVCNHYEYDAFGDFTVKEETIENRFGFTGEQYDPIAGLYYLRARFYNPVIGRFIQEDTYYGDGLNLYAYCANNPVRYIDPSGNEKQECPIVTDIKAKLKNAGINSDQIAELVSGLTNKNKRIVQGLIDKAGKNTEDLQKIIDQYKKIRYDQSVLSSLTNTQIFNNTAIEHIFKGNLDRNGNAGGYHYEGIIGTPGKTISGTELPENSYGVYKAQVQVNGNNKPANNGYSTFFPKDMSPQEVVDAINEAYGNKVFVSGTRNTYEGISSGGIVISMYINGNGKIISAFPKG